MELIYRIVVFLSGVLMPVVALFLPKIRKFQQGRKGLFDRLEKFRRLNKGALIWFHVASLGEYEQAKPVIRELKNRNPESSILLSFFSPSGYEPAIRRSQPDVDFITYLPLDTPAKARRFLDIVQPDQVYFVKYDLWYYFLKTINQRQIPLFLISASFRPDQIYFRRKGFFRRVLFFFDHIFAQNQKTLELLHSIGISSVNLVGDTRFDRVVEIARAPKSFPEIHSWQKNKRTIVIGSAWQEDMELLIPLINSNQEYKWIIAPHDLSPEPMHYWQESIKVKSLFYSKWDKKEESGLLFIDNIGMLSSLYQFAQIAYVGGAFGKGLHNILEPLGFGIPVIFGKVEKPDKFPEAKESRSRGCGFEIRGREELYAIFEKLKDSEFYAQTTNSAKEWVRSNVGAAEKIVDFTMNYISDHER